MNLLRRHSPRSPLDGPPDDFYVVRHLTGWLITQLTPELATTEQTGYLEIRDSFPKQADAERLCAQLNAELNP